MSDAQRLENIRWATVVGVILAFVGVVDGIALILVRDSISCAEAIVPSFDGDCYSHPRAGLGVAVLVGSLLLWIILIMVSTMATAAVEARRERRA